MSQNHSKPVQTPPSCCSTASAELKLYQTFIFTVPIFFTVILLFLFYLFYLRSRRVDWSSLRMRASLQTMDDISRSELGLKKEHREMLPVIVFNESFSVKDPQCSVCLADYQAEDRLQQIPACGHTFHMNCIDLWLATHTTCPLCRLSLIVSAKASVPEPSNTPETSSRLSPAENGDETYQQIGNQPCEEPCNSQEFSDSRNGDERSLETGNEDERLHPQFVNSYRTLEAVN